MTQVDRSALVLHSAEEMFALVSDVPSYPDFLPWCDGSEVVEELEDGVVARLDVAKAGFTYSFSTRNYLRPPKEIEVELVSGPFRTLDGIWTFEPLSEEACKVSLSLSFKFSNKLAGLAMGKVFSQIAATMVDAFCSEADRRYG